MDGLLAIDKPVGPTSHDAVARVRRVLGARRVGHAGTLDPAASGLLPLVVGRATRLVRFLSAADKRYEAKIRLGIETDTYDSAGRTIGAPYEGPPPSAELVTRAIEAFRGRFWQQPPAFSAKKIGGKRSHQLARARARGAAVSEAEQAGPELPPPAEVTVHAIDVVTCDGPLVTLRLTCSAGFYVRALAHDLGARLGTGAHLAALRRTGIGSLTVADAMTLDAAEQDPALAQARLVPMRTLLPDLPAGVLTREGVRRVAHGRELRPEDFSARMGEGQFIRLLDEDGDLVGIASRGSMPGTLHPSIVLM